MYYDQLITDKFTRSNSRAMSCRVYTIPVLYIFLRKGHQERCHLLYNNKFKNQLVFKNSGNDDVLPQCAIPNFPFLARKSTKETKHFKQHSAVATNEAEG